MRRLLISLLALAPAAGCMLDDGAPEPARPPAVTTGTFHHFVQTGWVIPSTIEEAQAMAFDIDDRGDETDNQIGVLIAALSRIGLDMRLANTEAFDSGAVVVLHSVRADSIEDDGSVSWRIMNGLSDGAPRFDGTDQLTAVVEDGLLSGSIRGGVLEGSFGTLAMRVPFFPDQPPLVIPLIAARVEMTPDPAGGTSRGRVGGAIRPYDLYETILPRLGAEVVEHMARHPEHEFTATAREFFDTDGDGTVSPEEVSTVAGQLIRDDVDLTNDGNGDAISISLGFEAVPAQFTAVE